MMMNNHSFGITSSIMTNKNHAAIACGKRCGQVSSAFCAQPANKQFVQCYTPRNATGTVSLVNTTNTTSRKITTDQNLTLVPANVIIDKVEFFGVNGFATKGTFSIGLGQLNGGILTPLIENTTAVIANERSGGCREFIANAADGKNTKTLVLLQSNVNVVLENPVTAGNLQVIIEYHVKPTHI